MYGSIGRTPGTQFDKVAGNQLSPNGIPDVLMFLVPLVQPFVDSRNLSNPALPLAVVHRHDLAVRPVEVIRQVRYLLAQTL
jgi:hypothetical protein